ncbi:hypothetical protein LCGC14_2623730 [marine sediment metagenome]|uniref:Uncharacterized protein n=1 Tax=marine sediment metagenome TaxID=412755 RepID=A0A0F9A2E8_9ZZZZ
MASRKQLIDARRKELLAKGYQPGIVNMALDWAQGSAQGMASYVKKLGGDGDLSDQFLPQYLKDCEKWAKAIVGEPTPPET